MLSGHIMVNPKHHNNLDGEIVIGVVKAVAFGDLNLRQYDTNVLTWQTCQQCIDVGSCNSHNRWCCCSP